MAIKKVNDASLTSVADAIREKGGTTANLYFPDGFVDAIEAIPTGGDTFADLYLKTTQATTYENLTATRINAGAFYRSLVQTVNMPNVSFIGDSAFMNSSITSIIFSGDRFELMQDAFNNCTNLTSVNIANVTSIGTKTFYNCTKLANVNMPKLESIGNYAFQNSFPSANPIEELSFPLAKRLYAGCFASSNVKKVVVPILEVLQGQCFQYSKLEEFTIPSTCATISGYTFHNCPNLKKLVCEVDLTQIPTYFVSGASLEEIDLSHCTSVPTLSNKNHINNGTLPSGCVIKVPAALEEEWKTATNWANFASQIQGV